MTDSDLLPVKIAVELAGIGLPGLLSDKVFRRGGGIPRGAKLEFASTKLSKENMEEIIKKVTTIATTLHNMHDALKTVLRDREGLADTTKIHGSKSVQALRLKRAAAPVFARRDGNRLNLFGGGDERGVLLAKVLALMGDFNVTAGEGSFVPKGAELEFDGLDETNAEILRDIYFDGDEFVVPFRRNIANVNEGTEDEKKFLQVVKAAGYIIHISWVGIMAKCESLARLAVVTYSARYERDYLTSAYDESAIKATRSLLEKLVKNAKGDASKLNLSTLRSSVSQSTNKYLHYLLNIGVSRAAAALGSTPTMPGRTRGEEQKLATAAAAAAAATPAAATAPLPPLPDGVTNEKLMELAQAALGAFVRAAGSIRVMTGPGNNDYKDAWTNLDKLQHMKYAIERLYTGTEPKTIAQVMRGTQPGSVGFVLDPYNKYSNNDALTPIAKYLESGAADEQLNTLLDEKRRELAVRVNPGGPTGGSMNPAVGELLAGLTAGATGSPLDMLSGGGEEYSVDSNSMGGGDSYDSGSSAGSSASGGSYYDLEGGYDDSMIEI